MGSLFSVIRPVTKYLQHIRSPSDGALGLRRLSSECGRFQVAPELPSRPFLSSKLLLIYSKCLTQKSFYVYTFPVHYDCASQPLNSQMRLTQFVRYHNFKIYTHFILIFNVKYLMLVDGHYDRNKQQWTRLIKYIVDGGNAYASFNTMYNNRMN